jgi:hypothetical protein
MSSRKPSERSKIKMPTNLQPGVPGVMVDVWAVCQRVGSHFLFRVPRTITARVVKKLPDGSRLGLPRVLLHEGPTLTSFCMIEVDIMMGATRQMIRLICATSGGSPRPPT